MQLKFERRWFEASVALGEFKPIKLSDGQAKLFFRLRAHVASNAPGRVCVRRFPYPPTA